MNESDINFNVLGNSLKSEQCVILSLIIISSGIINNIDKSSLTSNIAVLNITHTDSYKQNISQRINSLYENQGASFIFPLLIWKNNMSNTLNSTGNINRMIHDKCFCDLDFKYRIDIMLNNIKQNIPKQNYILDSGPIKIFNDMCQKMGLICIYRSKYSDNFDYDKIIKTIESSYNIFIVPVKTKQNSLTIKQIQNYRQYGIITGINKETNLKTNKRTRQDFEIF